MSATTANLARSLQTHTVAPHSLRRVAYWLTAIAKEHEHLEQLSALYTNAICGASNRKPVSKASQDALWAGMCAITAQVNTSIETATRFGGLLYIDSPAALAAAREVIGGAA